MADPIGTSAAQIQALSKDIQDLGKQWDEIARRFEEGDLNKLLKIDKASADMKKFMNAVNGVSTAQQKQHRVEKELAKAYETKRELIKKLIKEKKELDDLGQQRKLAGHERKRYADLKVAMKEEVKNLRDIKKLRDPKKVKELSDEMDDQQRSLQMMNIKAFVLKKGLELLVKAFTGTYNWTERLQKNLAVLAERFGTSTNAIMGMAQVAKSEFLDPKGLGGMGFELEEITSKLGDFREQMEFVGKVTDKQAAALIKMGMAVGISAQQVGEFSRAIVIMGGGAKETSDFLLDVGAAAKKAGVTAASLSRQFLGAGKSLFELTGPNARRALTESAAILARMGTGLDKLKGFIDMSDSFDKTTESMAQLNTVFGTHINAMEVFAEQDPAKRWMMVTKAMASAGMNPNMIRQEKKFLMDKLNISEEVANAGLRAAETGGDLTEELKKQADIEKDRLDTQKTFDDMLMRGKKVLINWGQLAAQFFDKMNASKMVTGLMTLFDAISNFIQKPQMKQFFDGMSEAFGMIAEMAGLVVKGLTDSLPIITFLAEGVGQFLKTIVLGYKTIKMIVGGGAAALGALVGGGGIGGAGDAFMDATKDDRESMMQLVASKRGDTLAPPAGAPAKPASGPVAVIAPPGSEVNPIEGKADGGAMKASQVAMVGERGPELFMAPSSGGSIINNQEILAAAAQAVGMAPAPQGSQGSQEATIHVQLLLDGEVLQDKLYKANLRRNS